jgi:hypothetical protein
MTCIVTDNCLAQGRREPVRQDGRRPRVDARRKAVGQGLERLTQAELPGQAVLEA